MTHNFAMTGIAGYIAPRHLRAIKDTGNTLLAAFDPHDSVGVLDQYFGDVSFFTEFERFDRHVEKLRRKNKKGAIDYLTICSPNYLHDAHIRFALRVGANAICEKPLVLNPWNLDALQSMEKESGKHIYTILQLRVHPSIVNLKEKIDADISTKKYEVDLTYITSRGKWYLTSWKGNNERSGGLATNIGIHFFDLVIWFFGPCKKFEVHENSPERISGYLELEKARIRWFLSINKHDLPENVQKQGKSTYRSLTLNGEEVEFSDGFTDLHTEVYKNILEGKGHGINDARPSVQITYDIRKAPITASLSNIHPFLLKIK